MWKGRFKQDIDKLVLDFSASIEIDKHFAEFDIKGSIAHAKMLMKQGILTKEEGDKIICGLLKIKEEIKRGEFPWRQELEDVHLNIEMRLTELVGDVGKKLHTARSRNDQVALDFRLFVSSRLSFWKEALLELISVFLKRAEENIYVIMPGYTHLQPAQPISLAHHILAYVEMFKRDVQRIEEVKKRVDVSPLGAAALAGTTYEIDPDFVAKELGLNSRFSNSLDAVSDRDFVIEALFVGAVIMMHLSRLCEEIILWANPCFGFVSLPDEFATGSSIMPQKKNPDICELMRGRSTRSFGNLFSLLGLMKSLPLAYNRDMQEDKQPFLDTDKIVSMSLVVMARMFDKIVFNPENMKEALNKGFLNATELADYLVVKGVPFREAHHISGSLVAYAEEKNKTLEELSIEEFRKFSGLIDKDVYNVLDYKNGVARRKVFGSTGFESVKAQIEIGKKWLTNKKNGGSV